MKVRKDMEKVKVIHLTQLIWWKCNSGSEVNEIEEGCAKNESSAPLLDGTFSFIKVVFEIKNVNLGLMAWISCKCHLFTFYFLQKYLQGAELPTIWKLNLTLFGRLFPDYHVTAFSCFSFLFYLCRFWTRLASLAKFLTIFSISFLSKSPVSFSSPCNPFTLRSWPITKLGMVQGFPQENMLCRESQW